jgi:hypothetical protein
MFSSSRDALGVYIDVLDNEIESSGDLQWQHHLSKLSDEAHCKQTRSPAAARSSQHHSSSLAVQGSFDGLFQRST